MVYGSPVIVAPRVRVVSNISGQAHRVVSPQCLLCDVHQVPRSLEERYAVHALHIRQNPEPFWRGRALQFVVVLLEL